MLSVCAPNVPQLRVRRPDLPGPMPPHPCVRVAVDERQVVPGPRPPGHQVKTRCRALGWEPVPGRQGSRWRCPAARRENDARFGGDPPAPPGFGCRPELSAARCERRNPVRTTRPPHVPMMPLPRCRDVMPLIVSRATACQTAADLRVGPAVVCCQSSTSDGLATAGQPRHDPPPRSCPGRERTGSSMSAIG
jgi:hypothetical protein